MILVSLLLVCNGCADLAISTGGTFVGNIMSHKVIKEMDKNQVDKQ